MISIFYYYVLFKLFIQVPHHKSENSHSCLSEHVWIIQCC